MGKRWMRATMRVWRKRRSAMLAALAATLLGVAVAPLTGSAVAAQSPMQAVSGTGCGQFGPVVTCTWRAGWRFAVPSDIVEGTPMTITVAGTAGKSEDSSSGGRGAEITASFVLAPGAVLDVSTTPDSDGFTDQLGGVATVVRLDGELLMVAGGGGSGGKDGYGDFIATVGGAGGDAGLTDSSGRGLRGEDGSAGAAGIHYTGGGGGRGGTAPPSTNAANGGAAGGDILPVPFPGVSCGEIERGSDGRKGTQFDGGRPNTFGGAYPPGGWGGDGWVGGGAGGSGSRRPESFCEASAGGGGGGGSSFVAFSAVEGSVSSRHSSFDFGATPLFTISYETTGQWDQPKATIEQVSPDPRATPVTSVEVSFDRHVTRPLPGDFTLQVDNGTPQSLASSGATVLPVENSQSRYRLTLPEELTNASGSYTLTLIPDGSVQDERGERVPLPVSETFVVDADPPRLVFGPVPQITDGTVLQIAFRYEGIGTADGVPVVTLSRDGVEVARQSTGLFRFREGDDLVYVVSYATVGGDGVTDPRGRYEFTIFDEGITDAVGNAPVGERTVSWQQVEPLTATIGPIEPTNSREAPTSIPITFSRPVTGFSIDDLRMSISSWYGQLTGTSGAVGLSTCQCTKSPGPARLEGSGASYRLVDVGNVTLWGPSTVPRQGKYTVSLPVEGSGIVDQYGLPPTAAQSGIFVIDHRPPQPGTFGDVPAVVSEPVDAITVTWGEPVIGVDPGDFVLTRNPFGPAGAEPVDLTGVTVTADADGRVWTLRGLSAVTDSQGTYQISRRGIEYWITDLAGNRAHIGDPETWLVDLPPRVLSISQPESPRGVPVDEVTVTFSEGVTGVDADEFTLWRDGQPVALTGGTVEADSDTVYRLTGLTTATAAPGAGAAEFELRLTAGGGITDASGNQLVAGATAGVAATTAWEAWGSPTVTIDPVDPALRAEPLDAVDVRFSHPVTGFEVADVVLRHDLDRVDIGGATIVDLGDGHYRITGLAPSTAADGAYEVTVDPQASGIVDTLGTPIDPVLVVEPATFTVDRSPPVVEIANGIDGWVGPTGESLFLGYDCEDLQSEITACELTLDGKSVSGSLVPTDDPGVHTFRLTATNGVGSTATTTATYTVWSPIPVAVDDHYPLLGDTLALSSISGVLRNDYDFDSTGEPLEARLETGPTQGSLTLHRDGAFTYIPDAGAAGTDTFTYIAIDSDGNHSRAATVTIDLDYEPPDQPPGTTEGAALVLEPRTAEQGRFNVVARASGLPPGTIAVWVFYRNDAAPTVISEQFVQGNGRAARSILLPADIALGDHTVAVYGDGPTTASATLTIVAPAPTTSTTTSTTASVPDSTTSTTTSVPDSTTTTTTSTTSVPDSTTTTTITTTSTTTTSEPEGRVAVELVKSAVQFDDLDSNGLDAGDTLQYRFTITNTGDVAIDQLDLRDPLLGGPVSCPEGRLVGAATRTCDGLYTLTAGDLGATLHNSATVTATAATGETATATDSIDTLVPPACSTAVTAPDMVVTMAPSQSSLDPAEQPATTTSTAATTTTVVPATTATPTPTAAPTSATPTTTTTEAPTTTTTVIPTTTTTEVPTTTTTTVVETTTTVAEQADGPVGFRAPRQAVDPCSIPPTSTTAPSTTAPTTTAPSTTVASPPTTSPSTTIASPPATSPSATATTTTTVPPTITTATAAPPSSPPTTPTTPTDTPTVSVAQGQVAPGQQQIAVGSGFRPGDVVTATQRSTPTNVGTQTVGPDGTVTFTWSIRPDEIPGTHTIELTGGGLSAATTFAVTAPGGGSGGGAAGQLGGGAGNGAPAGDGSAPATPAESQPRVGASAVMRPSIK